MCSSCYPYHYLNEGVQLECADDVGVVTFVVHLSTRNLQWYCLPIREMTYLMNILQMSNIQVNERRMRSCA